MINLIKNEFYKILHKKSTYIVILIIFAIMTIVNIIYKSLDDVINKFDNINYYEEDISYYNEAINNLSKTESDYIDNLIYYNTELETSKLRSKYYFDEWKLLLINDEIYNILEKKYTLIYLLEIESDSEINTKLNLYLSWLQNDDWVSYLKYKNEILENNIKTGEIELKSTSNEDTIKELKNDTDYYKYYIQANNYRINNNVPFDNNNYLSNALEIILNNKQTLRYSSDLDKEYKKQLEEEIAINEYIIENKVDINNSNNLKSVICNFYDEFLFLIILFIVMISGSILSEEFNKGTIKSLLILPFNRNKILSSKIITILLCIPMIIIIISKIE